MFLFRSHANSRESQPLSATQAASPAQEAAARTARDVERLERLTDIAMQLAERAGARAIAQPIEPPPEPQPKPTPSLDPHLLFARLSRTVKDLIAIKTRLAAGIIPDAPAERTSEEWQIITDPRRQHIIRTVNEAIKNSPHPSSDHKALRQQVEARTETFLANDPDQTLPAATAILTLCQDLRLPIDIHQLPDELLLPPGGTLPNTHPEPGDDLSFISARHHPP